MDREFFNEFYREVGLNTASSLTEGENKFGFQTLKRKERNRGAQPTGPQIVFSLSFGSDLFDLLRNREHIPIFSSLRGCGFLRRLNMD